MATINITVKDSAGHPLPSAYVNWVSQGVTLDTLATDSNGQVQIDSDLDSGLLQPGVTMTVSLNGYKTFSGPATGTDPTARISDVVLQKGLSTPVILVGAAIAAYLLFGKD